MNNGEYKDHSVNVLLKGLRRMMPNIDQQPVENDETSQIIKVVDPLKFDSSLMRDL
jgi:hypothetical protein